MQISPCFCAPLSPPPLPNLAKKQRTPIKVVVHFKMNISWKLLTPMSSKMFMYFVVLVEKKIRFLMTTSRILLTQIVSFNGIHNRLKVKITASVQLQRAYKLIPRSMIDKGVLSRETIWSLKKRNLDMLYTTQMASPYYSVLRCTLYIIRNDVEKVTLDVSRSQCL